MGANVLPIGNGKAPVIDWTKWHTELQMPEDVNAMPWERMSGIGIVCGINGWMCFDLDKVKSDSARIAIVTALGLDEAYPYQVKSGSGQGHHIWVRIQEPLPFKSGKVVGHSKNGSFDHVEVRWKACQTLVPPSLHQSGNEYEWINGEPSDAPSLVGVDKVLAAFEAVATLTVDGPERDKPKLQPTEISKILAEGVEEGKRNDTLFLLAKRFRDLGHSYSEALVLLQDWSRKLMSPLTQQEVQNTVESAYSQPSSKVVLRNGAEMLLMQPAAPVDIVRGLIREQGLTFLAGEEGGGKSLLAMNLGISVATGAPKFLDFDIVKHGTVLYLNNELPFSEFVNRFHRMRKMLRCHQTAVIDRFIVPEVIPVFAEFWGDLVRIIVTEKPILVILDCLYWAHDRKENDSSEMKDLMRSFVELRDRYALSLLVVHHTKKGVRYENMHNDNMRGSMVFSASSDTVLQLRRSSKDESMRLFKPTKLRHGDDEMRAPRLLSLDTGMLWFNDEGVVDEADHIAQDHAFGAATKADIDWVSVFGTDSSLKRKQVLARLPGKPPRSIDRALAVAVQDGGPLTKGTKEGEYRLREVVKGVTTGESSPLPDAA